MLKSLLLHRCTATAASDESGGQCGQACGQVSYNKSVAWQATLTERALELLALPEDGSPRLLLDLGCGSGLSGEELTNRGHTWMVRPVVQAGGSPWCLGQSKQVPRDWPLATGGRTVVCPLCGPLQSPQLGTVSLASAWS